MTEQERQSAIYRLTEALRKAREGDCTLLLETAGGGDDIDALGREARLLVESMRGHADGHAVAEAELRECRESCRRLKANIPGMVYLFALHPDGTFSFPSVSDASRELFAIAPHELMADAELLTRMIHPDDRDRFFASVRRSAETLAPWREELRHIVHGEVRWYDCISRPERHANGDIVWDGIILEITGRRRAEEALKLSEQRYRETFENAPLGIFRSTWDGRFVNVNPAVALMLKYGSPEEMISLVSRAGIAESLYVDPSRHREAMESVLRHGEWQVFEERFRCKDGSIITCNFHYRAVARQGDVPWEFEGFIEEITDRKRAEERLSEQLHFLQQLLDTIPLPVFYKNTDGVYLGCNSAFELFCGFSRDRIVGRTVHDLAPSQRADVYQEADAALFDAPGVQIYETEFQNRDGSTRDVIFNKATFVDPENRVAGLVGAITDISGRRRAERELLLKNDMLRAIIQAAPTAIIGLDLDGNVCNVWNPAAERMLGWSAEEVMGKPLPGMDPEQREEFRDLQEWIRGGRTLDGVEVRRRRQDGSPIDCSIYASPLHDTEGRIVGNIAVLVDITERKQVEESLRLANLIVENSPLVLFRWRATEGWPVELVSRNVTRFGYTPDELITGVVPFSALVHPDDLRQVTAEVAEFVRQGVDRFQQEYRIVTKGGAVRWIDDRSAVERDSQGRISHFQGVVLDITERKLAEEALRESEEKFRVLAQTSPTAIILIQGERIVFANQAASQISGYGQDALPGMMCWDLVSDDFRDQIRRRGLARLRGEQVPGRYECKILTRGGTERWVIVSGATMEYGGRPAVIITLLDITDTKLAEERIRAALTEKVVLLKEIHHRVKNNLQIISTLLDLQAESVRDEGALCAFRESQDRIRAMALVHEKLYRTENLSSIDFSGYIESLTTHLYNGYAIDSGRVSLSIDAGNVCLSIDQAIPCGLIISELVSNSLKYAFPGSAAGSISVSFREQGDGMVSLTVADSGVGLPVSVDFTASETLGLQLVRMLVKQLRGEIALDNSGGARFSIRFPMSPAG
jgi:PAS domain S-box-containing protein